MPKKSILVKNEKRHYLSKIFLKKLNNILYMHNLIIFLFLYITSCLKKSSIFDFFFFWNINLIVYFKGHSILKLIDLLLALVAFVGLN